MSAGGWVHSAACRDVDPEVFFPAAQDGEVYAAQVAAAKTVCARCPVRAVCLVEAMERLPHGLAGGLDANERRHLRRRTRTAGGDAAGLVSLRRAMDEVFPTLLADYDQQPNDPADRRAGWSW